jgi:multidrug efflux pump subunit AcrA (membrane-fusion protein)
MTETSSKASLGWFGKMKARIMAHKVWTGIIVIFLVVVGYQIYKAKAAGSVIPQYTVSQAHIGNIVQTVSGTGQISAENQLDVTSQVSGAVQSISVAVGDHVTQGQLLATIDPHDAQVSLQNAQLAYDKLTAPAKSGDLANAENTVTKAYGDAFNTIAATFADLPTIVTGMKGMLYDQGGFLSDAYSTHLNSTARPMRDSAGQSYDSAVAKYAKVLQEYQALNRNSPRSSIDALVTDAYSLLKSVSDALQLTQIAVHYITVNQPEYYPKIATTANTDLNTWISTTNSDLASVLSAGSTIASSVNSLNTVTTGADALDVESQRLSLQQAKDTLAKYFIRAPFDGTVGRIPVSKYAQASASTVIATIVGDQKMAVISLNEIDAAKVKVGQNVAITFDAIDGFTATGTVSQVDLVGTVSSGVVTYNVKISINTRDPRILPGMSVSAVITTNEKDGVLVVPSAAVKSLGNQSYVQVMASSTVASYMGSMMPANRSFSSTTRNLSASFGSARQISLTIQTKSAPTNQMVTTGISDDTNTEILSGIAPRQWVVTRTVTSGSAQTAAPSILNSLGGNRTGGNATFRASGATGVRIGG